jgi:hypothetical protein
MVRTRLLYTCEEFALESSDGKLSGFLKQELMVNKPRTRNQGSGLTWLLWACIAVGAETRMLVPVLINPLNNVFSDFARHYKNALDVEGVRLLTLLDQPGYEIFLNALLRITAQSPLAVAIAVGLLSVITPWLWYRWMRECLFSKRLALVGYAILSLLPNWIRYYSYFAQETLLLPLLGLALWMSWRAVRKATVVSYIVAAIAWGCASATKVSIMPAELIVWTWMFTHYRRRESQMRTIYVGAITALLMICIYLAGPIRTYNHLGVLDLQPVSFNRVIFEDGKKTVLLNFEYRMLNKSENQLHLQTLRFKSPSLDFQEFAPFSSWTSSRQGKSEYLIDLTGSSMRVHPEIHCPLSQRLHATEENFIFFWFGHEWPVDTLDESTFDYFFSCLRWIWLPLCILILAAAVLLRSRSILVVLCLGFAAACTAQQFVISEGRYRLPWEGIAIAAALSLLEQAWQRGKEREKTRSLPSLPTDEASGDAV